MKRRAYTCCVLLTLLLCACSDRNAERVLPLPDPDTERLAQVSAAAEFTAAAIETEAPINTEEPNKSEEPIEPVKKEEPTETEFSSETEAPIVTETPVETEAPIEQEAPAEHAFVGSRLSDKYHDPSCRYAQKIDPENCIGWGSAEAAEADGYAPCKVCNPE